MVTLYVDGVTYDPYLVTDDWPIHPSQIDVQLTVGACWQGKRSVQTATAIFFARTSRSRRSCIRPAGGAGGGQYKGLFRISKSLIAEV